MTVATEITAFSFVATGTATPVSIPFQFRAAADLVVLADGVTQIAGTDFTISGVYPAAVITPIAPVWAAATEINVRRATPRKQEAGIAPGLPLPAARLEQELDRNQFVQQEQDAALAALDDVAVKVPAGSTPPELDVTDWGAADGLPIVVDGANLTAGLIHGDAIDGASVAVTLASYLPYALKGDPGGDATQIGTFSIAHLLTVAAGIDRIATIGYAAPYDGGHAWYKRVAAEPAHAGKFQDAGGQWWEIDEDELYVEQFGGGVGVADNGVAINALLNAMPSIVRTTAFTGSGPYVYWGGTLVRFRQAGRYTFSTRIVVPASKAAMFYSPAPGRCLLKYTGTKRVGILFEDKSVAGRFGFDGVGIEGCDIVFIGSSSAGLILRNGQHTHSKAYGLCIWDALYYHDDDTHIPKTVTAITAASPVVVTCPAHGFTSGNKIAMLNCTGEERVNGTYWVTVIDADTYELYTNSTRATPLNGTTFAAGSFSGGVATRGFTPVTSGGGSFVWAHIDNWQCDTSIGHQMHIVSDSYLLLTGKKLRFRLSGKAPLVVDSGGCRFDDLEFAAIETANAAVQPFLWFPARMNVVAQIHINELRCGSESTTQIGGNYVSTTYAPPLRKIVIGPLDGSAAKQSASGIAFMNVKWYGDNQVNEVGLEINASANNIVIGGPCTEMRSFAASGCLVKNTHKDAGRSGGGSGNIIENDITVLTTFAGKFFHADIYGFQNRLYQNIADGYPRTALTVTPSAGVGTGTVTVGNADNARLFTLTITPAGTPSGQAIATIAWPEAYPKAVKPLITPVNDAARSAGVWSYSANGLTEFNLRGPVGVTLVAGTAYTLDVEIRGNA